MSGLRLTPAPRRDFDMGVRFTFSASGDSHAPLRPSACAAGSCGLAARPRGAGRAAETVAGATRLAAGSVRARGEVEIHTSPLPSWGRSRTNNPWREGPSSAASRHWTTHSPSPPQPERRATSSRLDSPDNPSGPTRSGGPLTPALRWPRRFGFAPEPLSALDGPVHSQPGDSSIAMRLLLPGPALLPAQVEARASSTTAERFSRPPGRSSRSDGATARASSSTSGRPPMAP